MALFINAKNQTCGRLFTAIEEIDLSLPRMTPIQWLIEQHIAKAGKLSTADYREAVKQEGVLIRATFAEALEQVGITAASAKKIAAEYYLKNYDT
jgi:hypothetical protein